MNAPAGQDLIASGVTDTRAEWLAAATRIARPVLDNAARQRLREVMPCETPDASRVVFAPLEAFARTLAGIAPWLEQERPEPWTSWARAGLAGISDPASPDYVGRLPPRQPLVDVAYLALALLRAPHALWHALDEVVQDRIVALFEGVRSIQPTATNWILFPAAIEACLLHFGRPSRQERVLAALGAHASWYVGDGTYGDGRKFAWDSYNDFVIQPFLVAITRALGAAAPGDFAAQVLTRARRHAVVRERFIGPEGTYPLLGRSACYRFGAFQGLADLALKEELPPELPPGQVRAALTAVLRRQLGMPGTFDEAGWLRIGFAGAQPSLAEFYITTGSLYMCMALFLPLGLPAEAPFWTAPELPWTQVKAWSGVDLPRDHALAD